MRRIAKKIALAIALVVGSLLLILAGLVIYFNLIRAADINKQMEHMAALHLIYDEDYTPVDEQKFVNFDLKDSSLRLNEIQILATHNSYKKLGSPIGKLLIGLFHSFDEANALKYHNNSLTEQLNHGVRSFELDLRFRKGDFEVIHVPLVDNSSTAPKFNLALDEIRLWSSHNPDHIPIMILLELKDDFMFLDPALSDFTQLELSRLDGLIKETFGDKLFAPGDIAIPGYSLNQAVRENGWPPLNELLGKVIFILHPGKYTDMYISLDPGFATLAMFPAASNTDIDNSYASFIVHNDPQVDLIRRLISDNYIVRTRLDSNLNIDEARFRNGMASGAQILTTDYGPNHNFKHTDYVAYPEKDYPVIANSCMLD
ncbi:MAG TPA: Ca2+-dependent phosphoinositide-specific phospholipase C [Bacillota bacterium]|jgi:hypothetical protein|nr:hypothetical protein [Bacillota bacterium]HOA36179.1 Ca2+-dependent phosphoinositide-specific phospholipase C [Bacillota bacterium]HOJ84232.1 Ca2+-dependent phosphoinositide-specific phospholipase C [Bacillota bacterium]HOL15915.1 Ca2+-dependent phosphoinositide-specific phospholipase C [Bacillota bacterium]HPZ12246.1 Ca2+-dependent phosphoinositide-specific phospholipase C [Bacillota bacterium]